MFANYDKVWESYCQKRKFANTATAGKAVQKELNTIVGKWATKIDVADSEGILKEFKLKLGWSNGYEMFVEWKKTSRAQGVFSSLRVRTIR